MAKAMTGVYRESISPQGVFECRDRKTEKNTLCWSDALEQGLSVYWPVFFLALSLNSLPGSRCGISVE